jgi:hypothetical protein
VLPANVSHRLARFDSFQDTDDLWSLNLLFRIRSPGSQYRPETSTFQWPAFYGGLHHDRTSGSW